MNHTYFIEETHDYLALSTLFHAGGVEVHVTDRPPVGTVKMWRMIDADTDELVGGIAVDSSRQGENLGEALLNYLYTEARKMKITELWASAKIPDYYVKKGWEIMDWNNSPKVAIKCGQCVRFRTVCHPELLRYKL